MLAKSHLLRGSPFDSFARCLALSVKDPCETIDIEPAVFEGLNDAAGQLRAVIRLAVDCWFHRAAWYIAALHALAVLAQTLP